MAKNTTLAILFVALLCISSSTSSMNKLHSDPIQHVEARQDSGLEPNFVQLTEDLKQFFNRWSLQGGLQAAVYHDGSLVYANSFGNATADQTGQEYMQDYHRMSTQAVSVFLQPPSTAAALLRL